jgi:hypothetical protein
MSNLKLREVIKQIRQCKTAAEERAVISKESALIRNAFKVNLASNMIPLVGSGVRTQEQKHCKASIFQFTWVSHSLRLDRMHQAGGITQLH